MLWVGLSPPRRCCGSNSYWTASNLIMFVNGQSVPKMNVAFWVNAMCLDFSKAFKLAPYNTTMSMKSPFNGFSTGRSHKAVRRGESLSKGGMFMKVSRRSKQGLTPFHIFISHREINIEALLNERPRYPLDLLQNAESQWRRDSCFYCTLIQT